MSAQTATCGCCSGVTQETPLAVENRPGLSAIAYRVGRHGDFLASMIAGLTDPERPRLAGLGTRDEDDFSIALLDAWAVAADILAFYNERLAQESYLRTARERISLQELGRLLGYRLRPGVAAETLLAFAVEPPPDVPATASRDPGSAPPVTPESVQVEPGLRVQSIPGPGEQPQTFETVEEVEARPGWNAVPAARTQHQPALSSTEAYLKGVGLNLKPGDLFLVDAPSGSYVRVLTAVDDDPERDRTRVAWSGAFSPPAGAKAYVLRKRIGVFGHNAPVQKLINGTDAEWDFALSDGSENAVDLDGSHPDIAPESLVVLSSPTVAAQRWQVESATELSRAHYAVSGKVTRLVLSGGSGAFSAFDDDVRGLTVGAVNEPLDLADLPVTSTVGGDQIDVEANVQDLAAGRRLIVRGTTTAGGEHAEAAVVKETQQTADGWRIVLVDELTEEYERESVVVHANVAPATHGETVHELLGSGRAREPFQRFTLAHEPLTYLQSTTDASGAEPALEVRVNDVRWDGVPTLYGAGPRERSYALRTDETGKAYVQFGDGARGARLPTGANNVRARYRKGLGAAGNVGPGALAQLLDRPLGLKGVGNPLAATGGVDPQAEEAARRSIPLGARTLERAVSLLDYEDFALAFTGVVKASAAELRLRGGPAIVVTVAFEGGDRLDDLLDSLRGHGDPRVEVVVAAATTETFRLALKVAVDPAYEETVLPGVEAALRSAYSFDARGLGEPAFRSEVVAAAHTVPGVVGVDVDRLYTGTTADLADRLLAPRADVDAAGDPLPAGVLVLDPDPLDWLEPLT